MRSQYTQAEAAGALDVRWLPLDWTVPLQTGRTDRLLSGQQNIPQAPAYRSITLYRRGLAHHSSRQPVTRRFSSALTRANGTGESLRVLLDQSVTRIDF